MGKVYKRTILKKYAINERVKIGGGLTIRKSNYKKILSYCAKLRLLDTAVRPEWLYAAEKIVSIWKKGIK